MARKRKQHDRQFKLDALDVLKNTHIESCKHAYRLVFEYIEAFYNTVRIHSHCDYMSPEQFEKLYARIAV